MIVRKYTREKMCYDFCVASSLAVGPGAEHHDGRAPLN